MLAYAKFAYNSYINNNSRKLLSRPITGKQLAAQTAMLDSFFAKIQKIVCVHLLVVLIKANNCRLTMLRTEKVVTFSIRQLLQQAQKTPISRLLTRLYLRVSSNTYPRTLRQKLSAWLIRPQLFTSILLLLRLFKALLLRIVKLLIML